jgi:hypothetical protein
MGYDSNTRRPGPVKRPTQVGKGDVWQVSQLW